MSLRNKIAVLAGSVILAGSLAGVALAANETTADTAAPSAPAESRFPRFDLQKAVEEGKLTQEQADLLSQIQSLRRSALEKLRADVKALVDQGVTDGKITQEQADRILRHRIIPGRGPGHGVFGRGPGRWGMHIMTEERLKTRLDALVEAGKITQERADEILQRFAERKAQQAERLRSHKAEIEESQTEAQ